MKEADHLTTIYGKRQGQRTDLELPPTLAEVNKGKETRQIVAEKLGMRHTTFAKANEVWDKGKLPVLKSKNHPATLREGQKEKHPKSLPRRSG
jgi:hypothetical protein